MKEKIWAVSSPEDVSEKINRFRVDRSLQSIHSFYKEVFTPFGFETEYMRAVKLSEKANKGIQGAFWLLIGLAILGGLIGFIVSDLVLGSSYKSRESTIGIQVISSLAGLVLAYGASSTFVSRRINDSFKENAGFTSLLSQFIEGTLPLLKEFQEEGSVMSEEEFTVRLLKALEGTGIGTEEFRSSSGF